jgi:hypothetical protein
MFTYDEQLIPVCMWITPHECRRMTCIIDERICSDTLIRVERIDEYKFVISDIWLYNSNCVYACSTFKQRYNWLQSLLKEIHHPVEGTVHLIHKSDLPHNTPLRGEEVYTNTIGSAGIYVETGSIILKTEIPDVYRIQGKEGYLRVPDLKTSVFLRKKGNTFTIQCTQFDSESWTITENIPELEVNASSF